MRGELLGHALVLSAAWHLSSFGDASSVLRKFRSWGHANTFLAPNQQRHMKRQVEWTESADAAVRKHDPNVRRGATVQGPIPPPDPEGFVRNGFENASLSLERLDRCARHCLDPYPRPRNPRHGEKKKVPPCLPEHVSQKELQLGKLRPVRPEAGALPPSFYEAQYEQLLFGYFPSTFPDERWTT